MPRVFLLALLISIAWPSFVFGNALCVTAQRANLRVGPGTNTKISWTVGKYMPLKRLEAKGGWLKVQDVDGETHWIVSSAVSSKIQCVVVKRNVANLRRAPAANAPVADVPIADKYTPYRKLDRDGAWLQIEDSYQMKAWVNDTNMWWPVTRTALSF